MNLIEETIQIVIVIYKKIQKWMDTQTTFGENVSMNTDDY